MAEEITIKQLDEDLNRLETKFQEFSDYIRNWCTDLNDRLQAVENWAEAQGFKPEEE